MGQPRAWGPEFHVCGRGSCPPGFLQVLIPKQARAVLLLTSFPTRLVFSVARSRELQESQHDQPGAV